MIRAVSPIRLSRDEFARLVLVDPEGVRHVGVMAVRAFPISAPSFTGRTVSSVTSKKPTVNQTAKTLLRVVRWLKTFVSNCRSRYGWDGPGGGGVSCLSLIFVGGRESLPGMYKRLKRLK